MTDFKVRFQTSLTLLVIFFVCLAIGDKAISLFLFAIGAFSFMEMLKIIKAVKSPNKVFKVVLISSLLLITYYEGVASLLQYDDFVYFIVIIMGSIAAADTGAYFAGKKLGDKFILKLAPSISPNKTVIGALGGLIAGGLIFTLTMYTLYDYSLGRILALGFLLVASSIIGDLLQSYCKRCAGLDDSGSLLKGHGGVWDRFDSHILAIPVFAFLLSMIL
ncbi:MAG TPA: hypothetical protein DCL21_03605 [Alphaproteobacteria bacterium]|nr:hypothetical protein [Alphaproteobacteria bacterium]